MTPLRSWGLVVTSALMLAGCGGLLGGGGKADLYRFGGGAASAPAKPGQDPRGRIVIAYPGATFQNASGEDRILTVTGSRASYIAKTRWVSPASDLFDAAMVQAFEQGSGVMLVRDPDLARIDLVLLIDVRRFEAVYAVAGAAPEVQVQARVRLFRRSDRSLVGEWSESQREPAAENRVTAIVAAFDRATAAITTRIVEDASTAAGVTHR